MSEDFEQTASAAPKTQPARILVVDDQRNMRATTALLLRQEGYDVEEAAGTEEALQRLDKSSFDLLLTDLRMEPLDGMVLLRRTLERWPSTQVVLMSAYGTIDCAVEAVQLGATDFLTKPFKDQELLHRIGKTLENRRLLREVGSRSIVGRSEAIQELKSRIDRVAVTDATVLITGESGTGKELVARAIHDLSRRALQPFVPVNCAALTDTLLESELFGHAKGAFTGAVRARRGLYEEADGGTLFLDEIGETQPTFQAKLLRALQEREVRRVGESQPITVDVRVVAATNQDLRQAIAEKRFREDLYYRLNVVPIRVPPLRERLADVPLLAQHFLERFNRRHGSRKVLSEEAIAKLCSHDYPGNVRELENLIEQAAALSVGPRIVPSDFGFDPGAPRPDAALPFGGLRRLDDVVAQAERNAILAAYRRHGGKSASVARELGVSKTTIWRKVKDLGLEELVRSASEEDEKDPFQN